MKFIKLIFLISVTIRGNVILALPTNNDAEFDCRTTCESYASQFVAINLLKSNNDIDGNQVYSPLGITAILALLAETVGDATYEEFVKILHYPSDRKALREHYKCLLGDYQNQIISRDSTQPSFQIWLYIYRNFSICETFRNVALDYYYVDVKDVNLDDYSWSKTNSSMNLDDFNFSTTITNDNSKDVVGFETLKFIKIKNEANDIGNETFSALGLSDTSSKTILGYTDNYMEELIEKETSKFDRYVDENQYVAQPQLFEELQQQYQLDFKQQSKSQNNHEGEHCNEKLQNLDAKPVIGDISTGASFRDFPENRNNFNNASQIQAAETIIGAKFENLTDAKNTQLKNTNVKQKNSLPPLEKLYSTLYEIEPLISNFNNAPSSFGKRSLLQSGDVASALSANSIKSHELKPQTKALLFNGLYFRANWDIDFVIQHDKPTDFFHVTAADSIKVTMLHAKGEFLFTELSHLNAKVVHLPYQNKKYSLLIFLPNQLEGIHDLIDKLQINDFKQAKSQIMKRHMHVIFPKLQVEETSHSESMLKNLGLKKIFSHKDASLNKFSDKIDLAVDEIVQFVNLRFDNNGTISVASLSPIHIQSQNQTTDLHEVFEVNRPFLYFLTNCEHDFVLVSGKVFHPEMSDRLHDRL